MNTVQYDTTVRDLVNFLVYMGEPAASEPQADRHRGAVRRSASCSSSPTR